MKRQSIGNGFGFHLKKAMDGLFRDSRVGVPGSRIPAQPVRYKVTIPMAFRAVSLDKGSQRIFAKSSGDRIMNNGKDRGSIFWRA